MKTCGLDVHKDSVFCAIYNGKEYSVVKKYDTTTPRIRQMGEYLRIYSRKYTKLQEQKTRSLQKMDRIMAVAERSRSIMCGFRIGSCMSNLGTKSVMNIIICATRLQHPCNCAPLFPEILVKFQNGAKHILNAAGNVNCISDFEVELGSELEIK